MEASDDPERRHLYAGITRPEEYFSPEEERRWMESHQAAKVLHFKEEELATLTREALEERWCKLYRERQFSARAKEEVMVATEVLLEYLDSTTFTKKNRLYYHHLLDHTRSAIDHELESARTAHQEWAMKIFGVAMLAAGVVVMLVASMKGGWLSVEMGWKTSTMQRFGATAAAYLTMSLFQPKNVEPPPDYATRYLVTPSAMEVEEKLAAEASRTLSMDAAEEEDDTGTPCPMTRLPPPARREWGKAVRHWFSRSSNENETDARAMHSSSSSPTTARVHGVWDTESALHVRREKVNQDEAEAIALLQLYRAEKAWRQHYRLHPATTTTAGKTSRGMKAEEQTSPVGDVLADQKGSTPPFPRQATAAQKTASETGGLSSFVSPSTSFWEVSQYLARNFGGGSRIQRMMQGTAELEAMKEEMRRKLEERA